MYACTGVDLIPTCSSKLWSAGTAVGGAGSECAVESLLVNRILASAVLIVKTAVADLRVYWSLLAVESGCSEGLYVGPEIGPFTMKTALRGTKLHRLSQLDVDRTVALETLGSVNLELCINGA